MKILNESIDEFTTYIINKKTSNVYEIPFNLNTEKLIVKIKNLAKKHDSDDLLFEISYYKNGKEIRENFDTIHKLIYRIKTI